MACSNEDGDEKGNEDDDKGTIVASSNYSNFPSNSASPPPPASHPPSFWYRDIGFACSFPLCRRTKHSHNHHQCPRRASSLPSRLLPRMRLVPLSPLLSVEVSAGSSTDDEDEGQNIPFDDALVLSGIKAREIGDISADQTGTPSDSPPVGNCGLNLGSQRHRSSIIECPQIIYSRLNSHVVKAIKAKVDFPNGEHAIVRFAGQRG